MKQQPRPDQKQRPDRSKSSRRPLSGTDRPSPHRPNPESDGPSPRNTQRNGIQVTTFRTPVAGPPTLMVVENDGRHVMEEQSLVCWVSATFDRKSVLELYGIDRNDGPLRYAIHNSTTGRWERCLLPCPLADMLEMLVAEDEFPFAFEATPSQAEVDWTALKARGQECRPMLPLNAYLTAATPESLAAVADDDRMRVRRGSPRGSVSSEDDGPRAGDSEPDHTGPGKAKRR